MYRRHEVETQTDREDYPQEVVAAVSPARKRWIVCVLCVSCFVMASETTMLAVVIPVSHIHPLPCVLCWRCLSVQETELSQSVSKALHGTLASSLALGTTYLLASAVFQPVISEISHAIGRKSAFLASLAVYVVGSILAATSSSMTVLLIGRVIQGAGGMCHVPAHA